MSGIDPDGVATNNPRQRKRALGRIALVFSRICRKRLRSFFEKVDSNFTKRNQTQKHAALLSLILKKSLSNLAAYSRGNSLLTRGFRGLVINNKEARLEEAKNPSQKLVKKRPTRPPLEATNLRTQVRRKALTRWKHSTILSIRKDEYLHCRKIEVTCMDMSLIHRYVSDSSNYL